MAKRGRYQFTVKLPMGIVKGSAIPCCKIKGSAILCTTRQIRERDDQENRRPAIAENTDLLVISVSWSLTRAVVPAGWAIATGTGHAKSGKFAPLCANTGHLHRRYASGILARSFFAAKTKGTGENTGDGIL
jgi:hypothetical protein